MTDITPLIPETSKTVEAIYAAYKKAGDFEQPRGYLGASIIGHSCERYLWYTFRACVDPRENINGRIYRLFETGETAEQRFANDLRSIGCEVHLTDPMTNQQFSVEALGGHFSGHLDGCALGILEAPKTWHVLEFKTHCAKSFSKLKKEGVEKSKPMHYAQMQVYMGLTGMTRALYLAVNKDTDDLYSERIRWDLEKTKVLLMRAGRIITSTTPLERISNRPDYYECSYCDAKEICFGTSKVALPIPSINCRQCCHATPRMDGKACWDCEKHHRGLSPADQSKACDDHLVLPGLISFARPFNAANDWIDFQGYGSDMEDVWRHGAGGFSTKELMQLPAADLTNPIILEAKKVMGAYVVEVTDEREGIE